jgi:hypothetical protein
MRTSSFFLDVISSFCAFSTAAPVTQPQLSALGSIVGSTLGSLQNVGNGDSAEGNGNVCLF